VHAGSPKLLRLADLHCAPDALYARKLAVHATFAAYAPFVPQGLHFKVRGISGTPLWDFVCQG